MQAFDHLGSFTQALRTHFSEGEVPDIERSFDYRMGLDDLDTQYIVFLISCIPVTFIFQSRFGRVHLSNICYLVITNLSDLEWIRER